MFNLTFGRAAIERAVKTFAQTLAALLVADGTDLLGTAWGARLSVAGMAALVSLLTSVGTAAATNGSPSLGTAEILAEPGATGESSDAGPVEVITDESDLTDASDPSRDVSALYGSDGASRHSAPSRDMHTEGHDDPAH